MSVDVDEVYRQLACAEAFAQVGVKIAEAGFGVRVHAEDALAKIQSDLATLDGSGMSAPSGLDADVTDALSELRGEYVAHIAFAEDRLGLPAEVQTIVGVRVDVEERRVAVAQAWIAAIDSVRGV